MPRKVYLLEFVNRVRCVQGYEGLEQLPGIAGAATDPLELAMGCRIERGRMRMQSPEAAFAVASATGLPVGEDRVSVALPGALGPHAESLAAARVAHGPGTTAV